jgi:tRNA(Ile)-lysidine synthase
MDLNISLPVGKYIVAVSGGVDSVVLLDLLASFAIHHSSFELVIAHFDHGIRNNSAEDAKFVEELSKKYNLKFELGQGKLGSKASEAEARDKRYSFLRAMQQKYQATAIITAHHQDDVIETSIINLLRGTGRRGLSSLKSRSDVVRPLLGFNKQQLLDYAAKHKLKWREDPTNDDTKYLRNKIRQEIVPKMNLSTKTKWLNILQQADQSNEKLDNEINGLLQRGLHKGQLVLSRQWFTMLPHAIAKEVLLTILYKSKVTEIDKKTLERLCVQIKTLPGGKLLQAPGVDIVLTKRSARFKSRNQS